MDKLAISVRVATMDDFDAVDALLGRVYPRVLRDEYPPSTRVLVLPRISRAKPQLMTCGTYYVATTETGQIVGAGGWTRDGRDALVAYIRHVVTDDHFHRQGIATKLLTHALTTAKSAGITRMICWSTALAEPFYASLGFKRQGAIDVPLDAGIIFPAVDMVRKL